ncbi:hypothetical protein ACHAXT_011659 [Thalassiosira profunda]
MNAPLDVEAELSRAEARLGRREAAAAAAEGTAAGGDVHMSDAEGGVTSNIDPAAELLARARQTEDRVDCLALERDVARLFAKMARGDGRGGADAAAAGVGGDEVSALVKATETCTALGLLLLQHSHIEHRGKAGQFRVALVQWYESLRSSARGAALNVFRMGLRRIAPEYPSNERSSTLITEALNPASSDDFVSAARCLVELQVIRDALQLQSREDRQQHPDGVQIDNSRLPPFWRMELVDELCQPLAERLRFHFLEEQTGIMAADGEGGKNDQKKASKMDRLPEWLFRYLRDIVDNHAVHVVMLDGVQPLVDSVLDSLLVRAAMVCDETEPGVDGAQGGDLDTGPSVGAQQMLQQLRKYCDHAGAYFLREVARMARHTLRAKSFFHHPDVVGSECRDRTIALRGIEQLFMFDAFIDEKLEGAGGANPDVLPPRMADTFLASNEPLLQWWLEEERDGIVGTLHRCAAGTLSSYEDEEEEAQSEMEVDQGDEKQQLYPPVSELFVALLHSARCKSSAFLDERSRQMYVGNVIAPLCSEYLDLVHAEASWLRRALLAKPTASSVSTVSLLRSANLPSDDVLAANTKRWASLITGTHISAQAVLREPGDGTHLLGKVGDSMQRLCSAMVEDFTSAFVETIVMERAKLASYTMRAPFLLSEPPLDSPRRGQREKDKGEVALSLSPDLNDSLHVLSIAAKACIAVDQKLSDADPSAMFSFGTRSLHEALKFAVSSKLLDIAIDPQGMTPEIYLAGAQQFRHDVAAFERLFCEGEVDREAVVVVRHGPMERVAAAAHLMSLEAPQLETIREALSALVVPGGSGIGSLFGRLDNSVDVSADERDAVNRLHAEDFFNDERLMEEASNMLEAKRFGALQLDEALSIINRRR